MWAKDRLRKYRSILDMLPVFPIQRWTQTTATVDWRLWHRCYRLSCTCLSSVGAMPFQFHNPFPLQSSLKYIWNWFSKSFLEYSASFHVFFLIYKRDCLNRIRWITFVTFFFLLCCYEICIDCRCPDQRNYTSLFLSGIEFICFHVCVQTKQCSAQYFWSNLTSYVKNTYKVNTS